MASIELKVLFSPKHVPGELARNVVALWVSDDGWNDFGKKLIFNAKFNVDGFAPYTTKVKLAFLGDERNPQDVILTKVRERDSGFISRSQLPTFYSLLFSLQDYRDMVVHFGVRAKELLFAINDLVALRKISRPNWYGRVSEDRNFSLGVVRFSEAFFAFHNADDVLDGLWTEGTSGLSNVFEFSKKLPGFIAPHHFKITYDDEDLAPSRIFVLIGENGVGKTQVLSSIVQSILRQSKDFTDPTGVDGRPSMTRLVVLEAPRSGQSPFPSRAPSSSPIFYKRMSLYGAGTAGIGSALLKLLRSEQTVASLRRGDLFLSMVKQIADPSTIFVRDAGFVCSLEWLFTIWRRSEMAALEAYGKIGARARLVWKNDRGYTSLSSGQSAFVRLAAHLSLLVERGTLLIIDEPETHLHPAFIRLFVQITDDLLVHTGSAAVIATHSAYIVREVRSKQVLILERSEDGMPAFSQPRLRTFGADVGAISFFIFKDDVHSALIDRLERRLPDDPGMRKERITALNQDIAPEAQAQLRRYDPD